MAKKIITTYYEFDENGNIKTKSVTETPYLDDDTDCDYDDCEECDTCDCEYDEDDEDDDTLYKVTPKGLACLAMLRTGLISSTNDPRLDGFWELFDADMAAAGYTQEVDE